MQPPQHSTQPIIVAKAMSEYDKKQARMIKNREAATLSRKRRKVPREIVSSFLLAKDESSSWLNYYKELLILTGTETRQLFSRMFVTLNFF